MGFIYSIIIIHVSVCTLNLLKEKGKWVDLT